MVQLRSLGQHGILSALGCVPRREEIRFGVAVSGVHGKPDCDTFQALKQVVSRSPSFLLGDVGDVCFFSAVKPTPTFFASKHMRFFPT